MPRAICRCGQELATPADPTERVVCPKCGARVRIRVRSGATAEAPTDDGYIRFFCRAAVA
jgi:DNA-directed RNA polymerase subunit RPC12/RpoP